MRRNKPRPAKLRRRWPWQAKCLVLMACLAFAALGTVWAVKQEGVKSPAALRREAALRQLPGLDVWLEPQIQRVKVTDPVASRIVAAALTQVGDAYDASYRQMKYPGGDVPAGRGACTDVVIRALRAVGIDLQQAIHQDMRQNFRLYPDTWRLGRTDTNIDHRRVPNHIVYLARHAQSLPTSTSGPALKSWLPGDIVYWKMNGNKWHTGILTDGIAPSGRPMVVHNGLVCIEQDALNSWPIIGHFRVRQNS